MRISMHADLDGPPDQHKQWENIQTSWKCLRDAFAPDIMPSSGHARNHPMHQSTSQITTHHDTNSLMAPTQLAPPSG